MKNALAAMMRIAPPTPTPTPTPIAVAEELPPEDVDEERAEDEPVAAAAVPVEAEIDRLEEVVVTEDEPDKLDTDVVALGLG